MAETASCVGRISAAELKAQLFARSDELAVLDVRTERRFGTGHLLAASSAPLGGLEAHARRLVPRRSTPVVLCSDEGDELTGRAAGFLQDAGYSDLLVLDGGTEGWSGSGYRLFSGLNTPGKALAAFAQRELRIPLITPAALGNRVKRGETVRIIDCRPAAEFRKGTIPGAINVPGAELARCAGRLTQGTDLLVVTCAGQSRGLTGAQMLRDAGYPGTVMALERGTMGWELSGRPMEAGREVRVDVEAAGNSLLERAARIRAVAGIRTASAGKLNEILGEGRRTTVLFDVRRSEEFEAGHISGARHVPGGQLIHKIDQHLATANARLVLSDDDGVRATFAALWLRRMGWGDVYVAALADGGYDLETRLDSPETVVVDRTADSKPGEAYLKPSDLPPGTERNRAIESYLGGTDDMLAQVLDDGSLNLQALPVEFVRGQ
ncbi:MAG: rhodanese-like domain-containing protein [Pseudomonadota bacterium]